jgi:predicted transcriptional regulator of viral defense system
MKSTDAYADLLRLGTPVVATREAAVRLHLSVSAASRLLSRLAESGLVRRVSRGLWALRTDLDPFVLPACLTAPYPAYVSLWSALARHGMIEQVPRATYAISLDRTHRVETGFGTVSIHHISPPLFGGFVAAGPGIYLATPEKALFDTLYVSGPAGGSGYLPELELPPDFDDALALGWLERIESPRLRTLTGRALRRALREARGASLTGARGNEETCGT